MIGAVVAFIIGALIALSVFLIVCEALPQWRYLNQRINRDVQTLQDMPTAGPVGMRYYRHGGYRQLEADGMWHWHDNDEAEAQ